MTGHQQSACNIIIHSAAAAAGGGSMIPVPGAGFAADIVAMTAMTMGLASVFGGKLTEEMAKGIAITVLKETLLKRPLKVLGKFIPFISPAISVVMIESAGWAIANRFEREYQ